MNYNKLIFSVAYNMTGDYETTKDVVQDINLKFLESPISNKVTDTRNYVIRTTINHCLNLKKKEKRLQYLGIWLPEPIADDGEQAIDQYNFERSNLLSYELAYLMELLSPTERAVFVLREAFDFEHKEIAESLNISADNTRQLYKRAKEKVANIKHQTLTNSASIEIAKQFVNHIRLGNIEELIALFNDDISIIGDGGGKAPSIPKPIFGKEAVANFLTKLFTNTKYSLTISFTEILSHPAINIYVDDQIICIQLLSLKENKISQVFSVLNPDKFTTFKNNDNSLSQN